MNRTVWAVASGWVGAVAGCSQFDGRGRQQPASGKKR